MVCEFEYELQKGDMFIGKHVYHEKRVNVSRFFFHSTILEMYTCAICLYCKGLNRRLFCTIFF